MPPSGAKLKRHATIRRNIKASHHQPSGATSSIVLPSGVKSRHRAAIRCNIKASCRQPSGAYLDRHKSQITNLRL
jgi:hypothetical protein